MYRILVINPGSTSTEISLFEDEDEIRSARIVHPVADLRKFETILEQLPYRSTVIASQMQKWEIGNGDLAAIVGRSALLKKETGTYEVNSMMVEDLKAGKVRIEHAAILGGLLADEIAKQYGATAYVAHIVFSRFEALARVSGLPEIERRPAYHVQNIEAIARSAAREVDKDPKDVNLVIAHLEGGMSIAALSGGRVIDSTNALDEGPFTTERSGNLPGVSLVELCYSGKYTKMQVLRMIRGEGGMVAYLGTNRIGDIEDRIDRGEEKARFYLEAMCYQIAKDIGAMATVLKGRLDVIVLTGKILESKRAVDWIQERVRFIAPVRTYPEQEALAFAQAALGVLKGEKSPIAY
jgi:butyrate kinase